MQATILNLKSEGFEAMFKIDALTRKLKKSNEANKALVNEIN